MPPACSRRFITRTANTPRDNAFRLAYAMAYKLQPDVYAVQGYDAAQMLGAGLTSTKGDVTKKADFSAALLKTRIDSPRGPFTISASHNPVQDIYLRQVDGKENKLVGVASKSLADPGPRLPLAGQLTFQQSGAHGSRDLSHPVPELAAVRPAAVSGGQRAHTDLRDHGRHQPGPR
jgi:hypothetical protein